MKLDKRSLVIPGDADMNLLTKVLQNLVDEGKVEATVVEDMLKKIRSETQEAVTETLELLNKKEISIENFNILLKTLELRFEANKHRHPNIEWQNVVERLEEAEASKIWSLNEMQRTGGEPDVVGFEVKTGEYTFQDCSPESPEGRRGVVYDREAEEAFKKFYPKVNCVGNAVDMAANMGIKILDTEMYKKAQKKDKLDLHSWSWIDTPKEIRQKGRALHAIRERKAIINDTVPYYYSAHDDRSWRRSFRGYLKI